MQNAEPDRHNFAYFSVNNGYCNFKVDKKHLYSITQHNEIVPHSGVLMYLYKIPSVHKYSITTIEEKNWYEHSYIWLHSICKVYTIEETKLYKWGNNVEPKRHYSLYRVILLKLFLQSYINDLRHRMWQPGTNHVAKLKKRFNKYALLEQV
jgi:hypothetical protein